VVSVREVLARSISSQGSARCDGAACSASAAISIAPAARPIS
jgi:hypothetical protein